MKIILLCTGIVFLSHPALAAITSVGGSAAVLPIPPNVSSNVFESNTTIAVFYERQGVLLNSTLQVDANTPRLYSSNADLSAGAVSAGTRVNSYLVHFDKVGSGPGFVTLSGFVAVDQPILGLMVTPTNLSASDSILGAPGTVYGTDANRGVDFNTGDSFQISSDFRLVNFTLRTSPDEDQIRIVTAAVPEPATIVYLIIAVAGFAGGPTAARWQRRFGRKHCRRDAAARVLWRRRS